jgi:uncharacterized protein YycO
MLVFPVIFLILAAVILFDNRGLVFGSHNSVVYTYAHSLLQGEIGSGYGQPGRVPVSFVNLEPGDIVLGGWPNCSYGRFSHAGLYLGNNQVLEGYVDYGLSIQPLSHYLDYSEVCLLRVEANQTVKKAAVDYAMAQEGKMFYPVAFKSGDRIWNCTKIIWQAYKIQGIDLDNLNDLWIAPESFMQSTQVKVIYEKGN